MGTASSGAGAVSLGTASPGPPSLATATPGAATLDRRRTYALLGVFLGVLAPVGWVLVRLVFFRQPGVSLWAQAVGDVIASGEHFALYLYMGAGTGAVLGMFGFLIGRSSQDLHDRAVRLDDLNREIGRQKQVFEQRYTELNRNLANFHTINADMQRSLDARQVLCLAAEGLHEILDYDRVNIFRVDRERGRLELLTCRGDRADKRNITVPLTAEGGALNLAVRENRILLVADVSRMPAEYRLKAPYDRIGQLRSRSFILCPIAVRGEVVGLFGVDQKDKHKELGETDVDTVKLFAAQVSSNLAKIGLLEAVEALTQELEGTFRELLAYRQVHAEQDRTLHAATASTGETLHQISSAAEVVRRSVDATRSAVGEISQSISDVSGSIRRLSEFMDSSISSTTEIAATTRQVQEAGERSQEMADKVRASAEDGAMSVHATLSGLQDIYDSVEAAGAAIGRLSSKGDEIGSITGVISEITERLNLLALNATIIAAQAGEQGRAFGVVAQEVRELSLETAASAGSIAGILDEIRTHTAESVVQVGRSQARAKEGIALGEATDRTLRAIVESAQPAAAMARDIREATREISRSVQEVSASIERLGEMSSQVSLASGDQASGTRRIVESVAEVQRMVEDMVQATRLQGRNTEEIEAAVAAVSGIVTRVFSELEQRSEASRQVIEGLEHLRKA